MQKRIQRKKVGSNIDLSQGQSQSEDIKRRPSKKNRKARKRPEEGSIPSEIRVKKPIAQKKKWPKIVAGVIGVFVVLLIVLGVMSVRPAQDAYASALSAKNNLEKAQAAIEEKDFETARDLITAAKQDFEKTDEMIAKLSWVKVIPYARKQFIAADHLIKGSTQLMGALETSFDVANAVMEPLAIESGGDASFRDFDSEKKGEILQQLKQNAPNLERAYSQLELAEMEFDQIPEDGLISQISDAKVLVDEKLPDGKKILEEVVVAAKLLPGLAGYPGEQSYLLLFQNNTELRPSGGFLGSYGELKVKNAEILEFTTHDVYGLDKASDIKEVAPWQIKKLAAPFNKSWYMRDSNWSPDFPESAENVKHFYEIEGGKQKFDGVIGITPDFISFLLEIAGPTEIPGLPYTFTSDNVGETLEFHVEKNFVNNNVDFHQRKDVISDLAGILIGKILALPQDRWPSIYEVVQRAFMEKHLVVQVNNEEAERFLVKKNWAGSVLDAEGDYVMVVDSNMASLKTDEFIERSFMYTLDATKDQPEATLISTYKNHAPGFTWKTTRYRNWNRIYVPIGSEFNSVSGSEGGGDYYIDPANPFEVTEELGKKSFGTFISIEPNDTESLEYSYTVPKSAIGDDIYTLYFQKQIGTLKPKVTVKLKFNKEVEVIYPPEMGTIVNKNEVEFNTELQVDREFKVTFK